MSKRNIVKGMGWAQRGSIKSVPVCRVCDEIMDGAKVGMSSWEAWVRIRPTIRRKLGLVIVLWVTFQIGLGFSQMDDELSGAPASVPIFFVIISVFLLLFLPKLVNNLQSGSKSSRKPRIITLAVWIVVLATFLIYTNIV